MPGGFSERICTLLVGDKQYNCSLGSAEGKYVTALHKAREPYSALVRNTPDKSDDSLYIKSVKELTNLRSAFIEKTGKLPTSDNDLIAFGGLKMPEGKGLMEYYFDKNGLSLIPEKTLADANK